MQKSINALVLETLKKDPALKQRWKGDDCQTQLKSILTKSKTVVKDENIPKRAKSPYLYFCEDNRDKIREELGDKTKATDITKELGVRWQKLQKCTKASSKKLLKKYKKVAEEDAERYKKEKDEYLTVKNADKGPKRSKSAYLYFCQENRQQVLETLPENTKVTEITKELGAKWREAVAAGKTSKYEKLAAEDKERYFREKSEKNPGFNGFEKFESEQREILLNEETELSEVDLKKQIVLKWKELTEEDKEKYC